VLCCKVMFLLVLVWLLFSGGGSQNDGFRVVACFLERVFACFRGVACF